MNNDLISRKELKDFIKEVCFSEKWVKFRLANGSIGQIKIILAYIDNIPTVESSRGECKTCKYYHPYYERSEPRGDGYCVIARMTPEGMTTINCSDEFSCSDYQKCERRASDV